MATLKQDFKLTPPSDIGEPFFAHFQVEEKDIVVYSTRSGKWAVDDKLEYFDLLNPQFEYNEWDIVPIEADQLDPPFNLESNDHGRLNSST